MSWYIHLRAWCNAHPDWTLAIGIVLGLRIWFAVWGAGIVLTHGTPIVPNPPTMYHGVERVSDEGLSLLLAPWQRWDAIWYERITGSGYSVDDASASFFPLYPILARIVAAGLANNYLAAALVVSTLTTAGAFVLLHRLATEFFDATTANRAVIYWATFPTSFYLFSGYAEPVLVFCALASLYWMRQRRVWLTVLASAGATLARPVGFLIAVPMIIEAWNAGSNFRERARALLPTSGVLFGMMAWMLYLQVVFRDPLLWAHAQDNWQRTFVVPGQMVWWTVQSILSGQGAIANNLIDLGSTVILLVAIVIAFKKLPFALSAYALVMLVVPLLSYIQMGTYVLAPMASMGRRAMVVFPAFIALACIWRGKWRAPLWIIVSLMLQLLLFLMSVLWLWVD